MPKCDVDCPQDDKSSIISPRTCQETIGNSSPKRSKRAAHRNACGALLVHTRPPSEAVKPGASLNDLGNAAARTNMEIAGLRAVSPGTERRVDRNTFHRGSVSLIEDRVRDQASGRA